MRLTYVPKNKFHGYITRNNISTHTHTYMCTCMHTCTLKDGNTFAEVKTPDGAATE